jgi:hypothetical protein
MATEEVRRCPKCEQPAVTMVMEWDHPTGEKSQEWRCQECGTWHVRHQKSRQIAWWIVGVLLLPTCIGLPFLYSAWRMKTFDQRVAPVPGAPLPRVRFPGGPPRRKCAKCGGVTRALEITRHTHRGLPTGDEYVYTCAGCGLKFTTQDVLGMITSSLAVVVLLIISLAFQFGATSMGWKWGGTLVAGALTGLLGWQWLEQLLNRFKHEPVRELE